MFQFFTAMSQVEENIKPAGLLSGMKITVIGAGPAGSYSAYLLAKQGHDVSVFETSGMVGVPWACTGVITGDVISRQVTLPDDVVVNKIEKARIIAPDGGKVEVRLKNDIIVDRAKLDQFLASKAQEAGATYYLNHHFLELSNNSGTDRNGGGAKSTEKIVCRIKDKTSGTVKEIESDFVVGCDGPRSAVGKSAGMFGERDFYIGLQVTAHKENDNVIEFFPSTRGIAWTVPERSGIVRAGIAAREHASSYFDAFMKKDFGDGYKEKIIEHQAGPIPVYNPKAQTQKGNVLLAGDAATMVKAPTLGGINQSLLAATAVSEAISTGKSYEKLWKAKLGKDLWLSLMMRKTMNKFSDEDYNRLVRIFGSEKNKKVLEQFDRDEPRKFAVKLALQEPRLWLYARKLFF
jgi:digeranylgeranylglycerophospholipid reductase